jgi:hypothetical protein
VRDGQQGPVRSWPDSCLPNKVAVAINRTLTLTQKVEKATAVRMT